MTNNRKTAIVVSAVAFIMVLSVVFVIRRGPAVKELAIESTTEINSNEELLPENTETIEVLPGEGIHESTAGVQDAVTMVPTVRTGLESTNPDTVKIASGNIQFVELFAFW